MLCGCRKTFRLLQIARLNRTKCWHHRGKRIQFVKPNENVYLTVKIKISHLHAERFVMLCIFVDAAAAVRSAVCE